MKNLFLTVLCVSLCSCAQRSVKMETDKSKLNDCYQRSIEALTHLGGKYAAVVKKIESKSKAMQETLRKLSFCQVAPFNKSVRVTSCGWYHEAHHFLGTFGDLYMNHAGEAEPDISEWRMYLSAAPGQSMAIPYEKGTPHPGEIYGETKEYSFLHKRELYLDPNVYRNFYNLMEEWNAYVEQLECCIQFVSRGIDRGFEGADDVNAVMEFTWFLSSYITHFQTTHPDILAKLKEDPRTASAFRSLIKRTDKLIPEAKKHSEVFGNPELKQLEPYYVEERGALLRWLSK